MSGILGIINLDGAPVDRQLLRRMTGFMAYRGPDAQEIWIDGNIGFGHTMLRTTFESEREHQPFSLDGGVWITADARVDGRSELIGKLESKGSIKLEGVTDVELILRAYEVWGEECVEHLIGDFAFAIWDSRKRSLFCARDHFGVKPFYHAQVRGHLIFSNTLNCVRMHPAVSDELNDLAIADFLLFDSNQEPSTTTFADIQRLPPAHCLTWADGTQRLKRYWALPADSRIRYRRANDYVEHFRELLQTAVNDRLRTDRVSVSMSGGLDSTAIAATAVKLLSEQSACYDLRAYAVVYDRVIPDEERYYSGLAAERLGILIDYIAGDDYKLYENWDNPEFRRPEPVNDPQPAISVDQSKLQAAHSRVGLTGWDGDTVLNESPKPYLRSLLKDRQFGRLVINTARYAISQRRIIPLGFRDKLGRLMGRQTPQLEPTYPVWINQALAKQLDLATRWQQLSSYPPSNHPVRPYAYRVLTSTALWSSLLESHDAGITSFPIEHRHPLLDLRLIDYFLSLPPVPWCVKKELLRASMRDVLPESVRRRPKSPLAGFPYVEALRQPDAQWVDWFVPEPELNKYVDRAAMGNVFREEDPYKAWINLRPLSLNNWLQSIESARCEAQKEKYYEVTG